MLRAVWNSAKGVRGFPERSVLLCVTLGRIQTHRAFGLQQAVIMHQDRIALRTSVMQLTTALMHLPTADRPGRACAL